MASGMVSVATRPWRFAFFIYLELAFYEWAEQQKESGAKRNRARLGKRNARGAGEAK